MNKGKKKGRGSYSSKDTRPSGHDPTRDVMGG